MTSFRTSTSQDNKESQTIPAWNELITLETMAQSDIRLTYSIYRIDSNGCRNLEFSRLYQVKPTMATYTVKRGMLMESSTSDLLLVKCISAPHTRTTLYLPPEDAVQREAIAMGTKLPFSVKDEVAKLPALDDRKPISDSLKGRINPQLWVVIEVQDNFQSGGVKWPFAIVKTTKGTTFSHQDVVANKILLAKDHLPKEVSGFVQEMNRKRKIGTREYEMIETSGVSPTNLGEWLEKDDNCGDEPGQNKDSMKHEGLHYFSMLGMVNRYDMYMSGAREYTMDGVFYFPVGHTICARTAVDDDDEAYIKFSTQPWPHSFHLPCRTRDCGPDEYVKYTPLSDNCFWRGHQPLWLSETYSEQENDFHRLKLQGASFVRMFKDLRPSGELFILPVIYIGSTFTAEIYYMYPSEQYVLFHRQIFELASPSEALQFTVVLYNLGDRKALWSKQGANILKQLEAYAFKGSVESYRPSHGPAGSGGGGEDGEWGNGGVNKKRRRESGDGSGGLGEPSSKRTAASGWGEIQHFAALARRGYTLNRRLRSGMSTVYTAWGGSGMRCVVKVIAKASQEIDFLKLCNDRKAPNILRFCEMIPVGTWMYVVLPFLSVLGDYMVSGEVSQLSTHLLAMSVDLARGLAFLHSENIAHLDINPKNLVFDQDKQLLIIDLGIAERVESEEETIRGMRGTENWMAPEITRGIPYSPIRADRFSCGAVFDFMAFWARDAAPGLKEFSLRLKDEQPSKRPAVSEWVRHWENLPLSPVLRRRLLSLPPDA